MTVLQGEEPIEDGGNPLMVQESKPGALWQQPRPQTVAETGFLLARGQGRELKGRGYGGP